MSPMFFSNGEQFYAVSGEEVFRYYPSEGWMPLPDTSLVMLSKFAPGLEEVAESELPAPLPNDVLLPQVGLAEVLKANPYHDERGRFSTQDGAKFVSTTGVFARARANAASVASAHTPTTYSEQDVLDDLRELGDFGVVYRDGFPEAFREAYPQMKPSEVIKALSGPGQVFEGRLSVTPSGHLSVSAEVRLPVTGKYTISRIFDPVAKSVYHDLLALSGNAQGAGVVKQVFRDSLPLYDKMGMTKVGVFANIDGGGYAWARYGFDQKDQKFTNSARKGLDFVSSQLYRLKGSGVPAGAKKELQALDDLLNSPSSERADFPRIFTALKTPHLDAALAGVDWGVGGSAAKTMLKNRSWDGSLDLTNKDQRAHLDDYIAAKPAKAKSKA